MGQLHFILNRQTIKTDVSSGMTVLDFIRTNQRLLGTKIGCREGDCGACTILVGDVTQGKPRYRSMTSCLLPLAAAHGKHIVTIEGLNRDELTPVQQAVVDEGGSQCGFCTVGFVVSLAGFTLSHEQPTFEEAIASIDGNICRCTGYKSLERAAAIICEKLADRDEADPLPWLVDAGFLPDYFREITPRLKALPPADSSAVKPPFVGGGTDLYVQRPEAMAPQSVVSLLDRADMKGICEDETHLIIGASTTAEEIKRSELFTKYFPKTPEFMKLVSSTPIRNMGTLAGNLVNASPIGDLTVFFIGLNAEVLLDGPSGERDMPLRDLYQGYKQLAKADDDFVRGLRVKKPDENTAVNFEKVSKRTYLDIASVNAGARMEVEDGVIREAHLSAGGVAPVPFYLNKTSRYLEGKSIDADVIREAAKIALSEVRPISDARGEADYKRLLLRQLIFAHFCTLFPEASELEALV